MTALPPARRGLELRELRDLRAHREDELVALALPRLQRMAAHGTTRVEVKWGYGLTAEESRRILSAARRRGLALKLHADELRPSGGAELAAELGATSADRLGAVTDAGIPALAASETVATLLPHTLLFLGKSAQAPARALIEAGAAFVQASDFHPGTSPSCNFPLVLTLAVSLLRLSVAEAVLGATVHGAAALGLGREGGQLTPRGRRGPCPLRDRGHSRVTLLVG